MNDGHLVLTGWGMGGVGLAYSVLALRLIQLGHGRTSRPWLNAAVLAAVMSTAFWGWLGLIQVISGWSLLLLWGVVADLFRYGCWSAFFLLLLHASRGRASVSLWNWMMPVAVVAHGFAFLMLVLTVWGVPFAGSAPRMLLLGSMTLPVLGMVFLEQIFRSVNDDSRWNIKPLCIGLGSAFLFDLYLFSEAVLFRHTDADAMSIRGAVHALVAPLLLLSTTRTSGWASKISFSPRAAFQSAALLMAGLYLTFIASVGYYVRYFGGEWGRALQLGLVFLALLALIVVLLSGAVRARLRVFLGKHFFQYRFDYREAWLKFTHTLADQNSPDDVGQRVIHGLADMLDSPAGGLWMRTPDQRHFKQTSRWNVGQTQVMEDASSALCQFLATSGWVVNLEEFRSFPRRYGSLRLPPWLQKLPQAWLLVPLLVGDELIGFCVLASARTRIEVNWEVNDLLKTAGQQAASYLSQMQATEALLEARKFDAFNRMSAFVVHDLKNIVAQLSLMMKNAKRLGDNPEFQRDMLMTVENSLERMRQLMLQLREGVSPHGSAFGVNLNGIVHRIEAVAARRGRRLDVQLSEPVVARGHEERLERVIGHLVQNALDATDPTGRVWLNLDRQRGQARVVVGDTGQGMSQDFIRDRLFKPFQTTKPAGMGIGAYESFQYVQELGGHIEVDSEPNKGTLIRMLLPLFEGQKETETLVQEAS